MRFLYHLSDKAVSHANRVRLWGNLIVTGMWDGYIHLWKSSDGEHVCELRGHNSPIYALDCTSDRYISLFIYKYNNNIFLLYIYIEYFLVHQIDLL